MEAKHTATPWEITEGIKVYICPTGLDEIICEIPFNYIRDFDIPKERITANAEFIVRAANLFDKFIVACDTATNEIQTGNYVNAIRTLQSILIEAGHKTLPAMQQDENVEEVP